MSHPLEKKSLSVAGVETSYLEQGAADTTMVLLHNGLFSKDGFCPDALAWEYNIASLARDFRVIAVDLLGQGATGLPRAKADYSYAGVISHLRAFLEAKGIHRAHLVGHDQGALVALRLAIETPASVLSCVIVNSPSAAPWGDSIPNQALKNALAPLYGRDSQAWVLGRQSYSVHHVQAGQLLEAAAAHGRSEKFARLRAVLAEPGMDLQLVRSTNKAKVDSYVFLREQGLQVPILLLWGTEDPMSSANHVTQWGASRDSNSAIGHARALFNLIQPRSPMTRLSFIGRAGYMPFREQPEVFNEMVGGFARAVDATRKA